MAALSQRIYALAVDAATVCDDSRQVNRSRGVFVACLFVVVAAASGCNLVFSSAPAEVGDEARCDTWLFQTSLASIAPAGSDASPTTPRLQTAT